MNALEGAGRSIDSLPRASCRRHESDCARILANGQKKKKIFLNLTSELLIFLKIQPSKIQFLYESAQFLNVHIFAHS